MTIKTEIAKDASRWAWNTALEQDLTVRQAQDLHR
jgi:hypothetical protein